MRKIRSVASFSFKAGSVRIRVYFFICLYIKSLPSSHLLIPLFSFSLLCSLHPHSLNTYQYTKLTTYVRTIYASPLLEYFVVKNFIKALPPGEVASANEVEDWSR